ncbi:hypothetical protein AVEN_46129-1 [Araneus ventricosus]|uniref:Tc1-like transposase DDE domain-containing protein n=1 Tax=Araneus ventricosus TaxID=182803 RepID=A0A4Y2D974_ARAVE|nr:hypothetical protein AVEN_46129-1 [Araneus ventricosus]
MIDNEGFVVGCIWFIDEAPFHLSGVVNKPSWRFWSSEYPHLCEERLLHSPKVTAWVANKLALEDRPRIEWFMQDEARQHHTEKVFRFFDEYFGNRVIALDYPKFTGAGMDWPPYSPDLTPCEYFLWGALKDTVYGNHPSTLGEFESAICVACNSVSVETLKDMMSRFILRLRHLIFSNDENFENIVF